MTVAEISIHDVKRRIDGGDNLVLLDVREAEELENGTLPGIVHIPMGDMPVRVRELNPQSEVVVVCRTGNRSRKVADFLLAMGFESVANMTEGMNGWAEEIGDGYQAY